LNETILKLSPTFDAMKIVLICRVSTAKQEYARQVDELTNFAIVNNWQIEKIFAEKISGVKTVVEREALSSLIKYVKENKIDKVLCLELSRLGRSTIETLQTIELLTANNISLYIKSNGIETLNPDGSINLMAKFMITILSEVAAMERNQIRERMKSGYNYYIKGGGKVGRQKGYKKQQQQYLEEYSGVVKLLKQDYPLRKIATLEQVSVNTVAKIKQLMSA